MDHRIRYLPLRSILISCLLGMAIVACDEGDINLQECSPGSICDDGEATTENDRYDANCNCIGTDIVCFGDGDNDGDGICTPLDCDDNNPAITDVDLDGDGFCSQEDCDDNDSSIFVGAVCDDENPGTENDQIDSNCDCAGDIIYGSLTDPRDGQNYLTIEIGSKTWMAENLNYEIGTTWCFDDDPINCTIYGKMYDWHTAQVACPVGWHLPTIEEWDETIAYLGGSTIAGGTMKSTQGWNTPNTGASNSSGFTGLPGGCKSVTGSFSMIGMMGFWWSATQSGNVNNVYTPVLNTLSEEALKPTNHQGDGFSLRCLKD